MPLARTADRRVPVSVARRLFLILLLVFLAAIVASPRPTHVAVAASDITWESFDVELLVRDDGSIHVTERQSIAFTGQSYSAGYAVIPMERIDELANIEISEVRDGRTIPYDFVSWSRYSDEPETYSATDSGDEVEIAWGFPTTRYDTRTFIVEYDVFGAIRVYTEGDQTWNQIWWTAISQDVTGVGDVTDASVAIVLPAAVDPSLALLGEDAEQDPADHTTDGQTWTWQEQDLSSGDEFTVRLEVPAVTTATAPSWQAEDDAQRLEEEKRDDRNQLYNLIFLAIGALFTVLAGVGLYGLWYAKGRDPHVGVVADFLPEPPDSLPPAAVGALIDETAHERDVVATVVDLGRRGVITIDEQLDGKDPPLWGSQDFEMTLLQAEPQVTQIEKTLLSTFFGPELKEGTKRRFSEVRVAFNHNSELIKDQVYAELVQRGYFTASPEQTRDRWRAGSQTVLIILLVASCIGGIALVRLSAYVFFPLIVVLLFVAALFFLSRVLPKKTPAGAEAAAKWDAFQRYLGNIEKYDRVNEAKTIFDKYLPYAVAFGLEQSWVNKFATVGAETPDWYGPVILGELDEMTRPRRQRGDNWGGGSWSYPNQGGGSRSDGSGGWDGFDVPELQGMSDSAGRSIQGTSNSLFDMLTSAAEAFGDFSSSGGSGGRRNWGGGGGGFRGGGSRGGGGRSGSSGGGRRGFR